MCNSPAVDCSNSSTSSSQLIHKTTSDQTISRMSSRYDLNVPVPGMAPIVALPPRDPRRPSSDESELVDADFTIRKRRVWSPEEDDSLASEDIDLLDDDDDELEEEEDDGVGCPLPSTPEDTQLLEAEMTEVLKAGVLSDEIDLGALAHNAAEQAEEFVRKV